MPVDPALRRLVIDRLTADDALETSPAELVAASCLGERVLEETIAGRPPADLLDAAAGTPPSAPHVFLKGVTAEGFRGIGPRAELALDPRPGLTVVVGRNGTGKSSFAEAAELALTGGNRRWDGRSTVDWREGLHNLHASGGARVEIALAVEGRNAPVRLGRTWPPGVTADVDAEIGGAGTGATLESLGWAGPAESYRPFLSYNELGQTFSLPPGEFHNRLFGVLGLQALDDAHGLLADRRRSLERTVREAKATVAELRAALGASSDERAKDALAAIDTEPWDLDALDLIAQGLSESGTPESELQRLQALATLEVPAGETVANAVRAAADAAATLAELADTDAGTAARTAALLREALALHDAHGGETCPVCGTAGMLDHDWALRTGEELKALRERASSFDGAASAFAFARKGLDDLFGDPPAVLADAGAFGLNAEPVVEAWSAWSALQGVEDLTEISAAAEPRINALRLRVKKLAASAQTEIDRRNQDWLPLAHQVAGWLPLARRSTQAAVALPDVKRAEAWLKNALGDLRSDRFAPISDEAERNWQTIGQSSHVALKGISLEGTATRRRVHISVAVDGAEAGALGVMSQGELHAIALSLFLPRATLDESPFRFVVIDDPVQAMDGLRVDGLARVLHTTARCRQVVVFTHDDRLPAALRRLDLPFTHIEVTRREGSAVSTTLLGDPVATLLDDARAVARTDGLPPEHAALACLGICRSAMEAACQAVVARRRIARGEGFATIEALLTEERRLSQWVALALLDDDTATAGLTARVDSRFGKPAADALTACNAGSHGNPTHVAVPLVTFVRTVEVFTGKVLALS